MFQQIKQYAILHNITYNSIQDIAFFYLKFETKQAKLDAFLKNYFLFEIEIIEYLNFDCCLYIKLLSIKTR